MPDRLSVPMTDIVSEAAKKSEIGVGAELEIYTIRLGILNQANVRLSLFIVLANTRNIVSYWYNVAIL